VFVFTGERCQPCLPERRGFRAFECAAVIGVFAYEEKGQEKKEVEKERKKNSDRM
jgi:hypothetical protein